MFLTFFLILFLVLSTLILFVVSSAFFAFLKTKVPFVPTSREDINFIVKQVSIKPGHIFYDLGSGNGKVCFLVSDLTGAKCVGYELGMWMHCYAILKAKFVDLKQKPNFKKRDFFREDWSEADFIYAYLYPPLMEKVQKKFLKDGKTGAVAIIRDFPFPSMSYEKKYFLPKNHEIYIYRK